MNDNNQKLRFLILKLAVKSCGGNRDAIVPLARDMAKFVEGGGVKISGDVWPNRVEFPADGSKPSYYDAVKGNQSEKDCDSQKQPEKPVEGNQPSGNSDKLPKVSLSQMKYLLAIDELSDFGLPSVSILADKVAVQTSSCTTAVKRLAAKGLVNKINRGRNILVSLTDTAKDIIAAAKDGSVQPENKPAPRAEDGKNVSGERDGVSGHGADHTQDGGLPEPCRHEDGKGPEIDPLGDRAGIRNRKVCSQQSPAAAVRGNGTGNARGHKVLDKTPFQAGISRKIQRPVGALNMRENLIVTTLCDLHDNGHEITTIASVASQMNVTTANIRFEIVDLVGRNWIQKDGDLLLPLFRPDATAYVDGGGV